MTNLSHFEELGVLNEGIGSDRISDITATIIKRRLISYTQQIAKRHNLQTEPHAIYASSLDEQRLRWTDSPVALPVNPFKQTPLLFVPARFLKELPTLNAVAWWHFHENAMLRDDLNYELLGQVDKKTIIETARRNVESVRQWSSERESHSADSYDFDRDPQGLYSWDPQTRSFVKANPLVITPARDLETFSEVIEAILNQYQLFVEQQGGWSLLWASFGVDKPEQAAQLLFRGLAQSYCKANDISLDAEVNLGRGPVDFKFSTGFKARAHLEVKKLHNGKFWNGLEQQLPSYMRSDEVELGWFLAIRYRDNKSSAARARDLPGRVDVLGRESNLDIHYRLIDARPKESASKL